MAVDFCVEKEKQRVSVTMRVKSGGMSVMTSGDAVPVISNKGNDAIVVKGSLIVLLPEFSRRLNCWMREYV